MYAQVALCLDRGRGAIPGSDDTLAKVRVLHVACGKDAGHVGSLVVVREHVSGLVQVDLSLKDLGRRDQDVSRRRVGELNGIAM